MFKKLNRLNSKFIIFVFVFFLLSISNSLVYSLAVPSSFQNKQFVEKIVISKELLQEKFAGIFSIHTEGKPLDFDAFFSQLDSKSLDEIRSLLIITAERNFLNLSKSELSDFSRHMLENTSQIKAGPENLLKKCFLLDKEVGELEKDLTKAAALAEKKLELATAKAELDAKVVRILQAKERMLAERFQGRLLSPEALLNYTKQECFHKVDIRNIFRSNIFWLRNNIIAGLISGLYSKEWVNENFFFDYNTGWFIPKFSLESIVSQTHHQIQRVSTIDMKATFDVQKQSEGYEALGEAVKERIDLKGIEKPLIVGVSGGSASGKSTFTEYFEKHNERLRVLTVHLDDFYTPALGRVVFDTLYGKEALKFEEMRQLYLDIQNKRPVKIKQGQSVITVNPRDYDIIFVEGIFPFAFFELPDIFDFKVSVWQDDFARLTAKILRGRASGAVGAVKNTERFFQNKYQEQDFFIAPELEASDIIFDVTKGIVLSKNSEAELQKAA